MAAAKKQHEPQASRDAVMESLRPRFLESMRKRQLALLKLRGVLGKSEMSSEGYAALRKIAHAVYGSAGTFGYDDVAKAAAVLEKTAEHRAVHGRQTILDALDALLKSCRAAQRTDARPARAAPANEPTPPIASPTVQPDDIPQIVLVEDDPTMQAIVVDLLAGEGAVHSADNAEDARRLLDALSPALAIVDINLAEGASGLELVEALKADPRHADLPVIMLTGSDKPDDVMRALVGGAVDYIAKPIQASAFVQKIRDFLHARRMLVLIADDDAPVRETLARKFQALGVKTLEAVTGEDAFAMVRGHKPSLVLLDRMMPGLDGVTVLQQMRNDSALRQIPVVFLTARRNDSDVLEGLKLGAADYIVKPFNPDIVVTRCMRLIEGVREAS